MDRAELAVEKYRSGYNCAQAVACVFADVLGVDETLLYKAAEGFGGGMGTGKGVCGAVSGAAIVAGMLNSDGNVEQAGATKAGTTRMSGQVQREFVKQAGALICSEIKGSEKPTSCPDCIRIAVRETEKMINKK